MADNEVNDNCLNEHDKFLIKFGENIFEDKMYCLANDVKKYGIEGTWNDIEKRKDPLVRLERRKYFYTLLRIYNSLG